MREKDIVLLTQDFFWKEAADRGHAVYPTRVVDVFVPIGERAACANRLGVDLFVSLHANASSSPAARGPWTLYAAPGTRSRALARTVQRRIATVAGGNPDAAYPDASNWTGGRRLGVLRQTGMPAVLVELGFMTNAADIQRLENPGFLRQMARAVVLGVEEWAGQ